MHDIELWGWNGSEVIRLGVMVASRVPTVGEGVFLRGSKELLTVRHVEWKQAKENMFIPALFLTGDGGPSKGYDELVRRRMVR